MNRAKKRNKWISAIMTSIIIVLSLYPQNIGAYYVDAEEKIDLTEENIYKIISKESNKVIEVSNLGTYNGDQLQQWDYTKEESQQWKVEREGEFYKFVNENSNKVLSINENAIDGDLLFQWDDTDSDTQLWYLEECKDGYFQIKSKANQKCIDVVEISKENGAKLQVWEDVDGNNQKWKFAEVEKNDKIVSGAKYKITSKNSGKSIEVGYNSQDDGGTVQQWDYEQGSNQQWFIEKVEEKYYKIIADHSGKVLTVKDGKTENGTLVEQRAYNGGDNQLWYFSEDPNGDYRIRSKQSQKVLDVKDISQENGALIQIWKNEDGDNQKWSLEMITCDSYPTIYLYTNYDEETHQIKVGWDAGEEILEVELYGRYNQESEFQKITQKTLTEGIQEGNTIKYKEEISSEEILNYADFRVVERTKYGKEILSSIVSIKREDGTFKEDVYDSDQDGINDGYEIWDLSTNPYQMDTDEDGFIDGYEVLTLCTNPLEITEDADFDNDGFSNLEEMTTGTNPYLVDTDFDGVNDKWDSSPLTAEKSVEDLEYDLFIPTGYYDKKICGYDEEGEYFEYIYNTLLDVYRYGQIGENDQIYNFYDIEGRMFGNIVLCDGKSIINSYGYDDSGNITNVSHNGFGYEVSYDENSNVTSVDINGKKLISVMYDQQTHTQKEIIYGNGDKREYVYDGERKLSEIKVDETTLYEYSYDENENVTKEKDYENDIIYRYEYDESGELVSLSTNQDFSIQYTLDENADKNSVCYYLGNSEKTCTYSEEGENSSTNFGKLGKIVTTTDVDNNKVTKQTFNAQDQLILNQQRALIDDNTIEINTNGAEKIQYEYDKNGNIQIIYKNGEEIADYEYNFNDQLIRENNKELGMTKLYFYDEGGNITQEQEYAYTKEAVIPENIVNNSVYSYDNQTWKDLLTEYNGQSITYDEIGNPIQYANGKCFSWKDGRKLAEYTDGENNAQYFYNSSNQRVKKIVNDREISYNYAEDKLISQQDENGYIYFLYSDEGNLVGFEKENQTYYYQKNGLNDIVGIYSQNGEKLVEYYYDAWGNMCKIDGNTELGNINPFRYRSYYYDSESGLYYLINRYYDSKVKRFLNADQYISLQEENLLSYAKNNPLKYADPSGNAIETIVDIASMGWSFISLIKNPSWINFGYLAWDVGSVFIPFVPGSYVAKGGSKLLKVASKTSDFKTAKYLTIGTYSKLKKIFKGSKNVEVHHLIEKRFRNIGKMKYKGKKVSAGRMMAVPMSKSLHRTITNRWKKEIPYGVDYKNISKARMIRAINNVYYDMPALKKYALKYLDEVWK